VTAEVKNFKIRFEPISSEPVVVLQKNKPNQGEDVAKQFDVFIDTGRDYVGAIKSFFWVNTKYGTWGMTRNSYGCFGILDEHGIIGFWAGYYVGLGSWVTFDFDRDLMSGIIRMWPAKKDHINKKQDIFAPRMLYFE